MARLAPSPMPTPRPQLSVSRPGPVDRQIPALRPFKNQQMRPEFEKLTEQLHTAPRTPEVQRHGTVAKTQ
jgi:hypothetical protein